MLQILLLILHRLTMIRWILLVFYPLYDAAALVIIKRTLKIRAYQLTEKLKR